MTLELIPGFSIHIDRSELAGRRFREVKRLASYRCGELANLAGVSPDTLRHYERKGILRPARSANGYRRYSEAALERVRMVRRALALGFSLDELSRIFGERDQGGTPCREVRSLAARKLKEARAKLVELESLCQRLETLLSDWDSRLEESDGGRVELLRSLPAVPESGPTAKAPPQGRQKRRAVAAQPPQGANK